MMTPIRDDAEAARAAAREGEPGIYARLASQSDRRLRRLTPPRGTRAVGFALCVAIAATIAVAADRVPAP